MTEENPMPRRGNGSIRPVPLWVKVGYTAFLCVLVPYYWRTYGPTNFLYFCDTALLLTLAALWLEMPLCWPGWPPSVFSCRRCYG